MNDFEKSTMEKLRSQEHTPLTVFENIDNRLRLLFNFKKIILNHVNELDINEKYKKAAIEKLYDPTTMIIEYVIHEIRSFYRQVYIRFNNEFEYPYYKEIKEFRDVITGHLEDIPPKKIVELYEKMSTLYPEIIKAYDKLKEQIFKKLSGGE